MAELSFIQYVRSIAENLTTLINIDANISKIAIDPVDVKAIVEVRNNLTAILEVNAKENTVNIKHSEVLQKANIILYQYNEILSINNDLNTKYDETVQNFSDAQLIKWEAEAYKKTAQSYATQPVDEFVQIYTSKGNGDFSSISAGVYSSMHYKTKADEKAATVPTNTDGFIPFTMASGLSNPLFLFVIESTVYINFTDADGTDNNIAVLGA